MDGRDERPVLLPVGGSSKPPLRLAALAVLLIGLAILKPWGALTGPDAHGSLPAMTTGPTLTAPVASPTPGETAAPTSNPEAIQCLEPAGWRIVTLQRSDVRESRSWIVIQPRLVATGPSDPSIAPFRLAEDDVTAIGFCGSGQRQGTSPVLVVGVWQQAANRSWKPQAIAGSRLGGIDGGGVATVYAPVAVVPGLNGSAGGQVSGVPAGSGRAGVPAGSGASSSSGIPSSIAGSSPWAPGRYVFKVIVANTPTSTYWFRIDLIWPPEPLPSESPLPSATPPTASPSVALPPG